MRAEGETDAVEESFGGDGVRCGYRCWGEEESGEGDGGSVDEFLVGPGPADPGVALEDAHFGVGGVGEGVGGMVEEFDTEWMMW